MAAERCTASEYLNTIIYYAFTFLVCFQSPENNKILITFRRKRKKSLSIYNINIERKHPLFNLFAMSKIFRWYKNILVPDIVNVLYTNRRLNFTQKSISETNNIRFLHPCKSFKIRCLVHEILIIRCCWQTINNILSGIIEI